jgi:hypothetical protein
VPRVPPRSVRQHPAGLEGAAGRESRELEIRRGLQRPPPRPEEPPEGRRGPAAPEGEPATPPIDPPLLLLPPSCRPPA